MKTYSFKNVTLLINEVPVKDWDEGDDVIRSMRRKEAISDKVGVDGSIAVAIRADISGSLKFKIKQTSETREMLLNLVNLAQAGLFTPVSYRLVDSLNKELEVGTAGYVTGYPEMVRGENINTEEWEIICGKVIRSVVAPGGPIAKLESLL